GFGAVVVEYFQRLAPLQHLIDVRPEHPATAGLVPGETAGRRATPFDSTPRLLDVRSIARAGGRHHHAHVGVHVLRPIVPVFPAPKAGSPLDFDALAGVPVARAWPDVATQHAGYFQLSAQPRRPLRLFNPDRRSQTNADRVVVTDLRDRLRRLPLHLETEELRRAAVEARAARVGEAPWFDDTGLPFTIFLRAVGATTFTRVAPAEMLIANLEQFRVAAGARPAAAKTYEWFENGATAREAHGVDGNSVRVRSGDGAPHRRAATGGWAGHRGGPRRVRNGDRPRDRRGTTGSEHKRDAVRDHRSPRARSFHPHRRRDEGSDRGADGERASRAITGSRAVRLGGERRRQTWPHRARALRPGRRRRPRD